MVLLFSDSSNDDDDGIVLLHGIQTGDFLGDEYDIDGFILMLINKKFNSAFT